MSSPVALVTGGGSGVGRAVAIALAARSWRVAILGRTASSLDETRRLAGGVTAAHVVDIGRVDEVDAAVAATLSSWERLDAVINAAGTNTPRRSIAEVDLDKYHEIVATNLHGSFYVARAALPTMRAARRGVIVNVVSIAGLRASTLSGVAYAMSKFGQAGLTQSINAEENQHGVRACSVFPGDIATRLLEQRAHPPPAEARAKMLTAEDVAQCVLLAIDLPERAVVEEIVVRPRG